MKKILLTLLTIATLASCQDRELREEIETPTPDPIGCVCGEVVARNWGENGTRWLWMESDCTGEIKEIQVQPYFYDLHGVPDHICLDSAEVVGELVPW